MGTDNIIQIAAGGNLAQVRTLLFAAKQAGYEAALLRKFNFSKEDIAALKQEFKNPFEVVVIPEFQHHESLCFSRDVAAGELLTEEVIIPAAPLSGVTSAALPKLLNKKILYDMKKGQPLTLGVIDL